MLRVQGALLSLITDVQPYRHVDFQNLGFLFPIQVLRKLSTFSTFFRNQSTCSGAIEQLDSNPGLGLNQLAIIYIRLQVTGSRWPNINFRADQCSQVIK
jgi:hypothetical protein